MAFCQTMGRGSVWPKAKLLYWRRKKIFSGIIQDHSKGSKDINKSINPKWHTRVLSGPQMNGSLFNWSPNLGKNFHPSVIYFQNKNGCKILLREKTKPSLNPSLTKINTNEIFTFELQRIDHDQPPPAQCTGTRSTSTLDKRWWGR